MKLLNQALKENLKLLNSTREELAHVKQEIAKQTTEMQCINCHKFYHPKVNGETACSYHPGKIKFYSCK